MRLRTPSQRRRCDRGAAAVEFALVLPLLLVLLFGIMQYGLYFWTMQGVSAAARDAARRAAVGDPAGCDQFKDTVTDAIKHLGDETAVTIERAYFDSATGNPLASAQDVEVGDKVQVSVIFTSYNLHVPLLPLLADGIVTERVESRVDYVPTQPERPCA